MEVLNAAGLTPLASLHKAASSSSSPGKRAEARRSLLPLRIRNLAALSSVLGAGGLARALTYEEALNQTFGSSSPFPDFDLSGLLDGIVSFVTDNPLIVGGAGLALAVPLVISQVLNLAQSWGVESAKGAYAKLSEDSGAQLLDIREGKDLRQVGSPDLRGLKKKAVAITYRGDDKQRFLKKLELKFKDPANTTLYILDKFDGNSELVAELVTLNGFKAAYAIKDGAEGTRGWMSSGLPWLQPKQGVDFSNLKDSLVSIFEESSDGLAVTLGLAAATGLGILASTEIETVLQLLGSAALIQFVTKRLLFAKDRKVTLQQLDEFLNTKVAPKELVDEIKMIGKALLPASTSATASPEVKPETKVEASTEPAPVVNSIPNAEVEADSLPATPTPLSPYPYYPDLKPPTSPSPSAP
ncbi:rhodanese-like domain-containing protein 4, chloroplastic [Zingiber officinale]|uniref:rhodanese-like domain-containing protein 4, chloroplastic n=1 Tax=Zingiber officinale TaxID=94328 RepID=UPI001C4BEA1F|nr:rhodanese-like domain-containing protein 4, chloroplastic [Zingiber officinale]